MSSAPRCVLFLQGSPSVFSRVFADTLERRGARCLRINLCPGDWLMWHDKRVTNYRKPLSEWREFLKDFVVHHGVTHIVYYADRLPYHIIAGELAQEMSIEAVAYEFGYLRPDWMTFERVGMSAHSRFPTDPQAILEAARDLPDPDMSIRYPYKFTNEAIGEVIFHLSNIFLKPFFPNYDRDKYYHPLSEYIHYFPKLFLRNRRHSRAKRLMRHLINMKISFFLIPLQLQSDRQILFNSPYQHISEFIKVTIKSFSENSIKDDWLIFKIHPLDNWIEPWNKIVRSISQKYNVNDRVKVIDGGLLNEILPESKGVIVINSTVGLSAIRTGTPVKVLGIAVYDIEGLTCGKPLDAFWTEPTKPDEDLLVAFERLLANTIQIKGNVYTKAGRQAAAEVAADRLMNGTVNLPGALVEPPPRFAKARELGISVSFDEHMRRRGRRNRWFNDAMYPLKVARRPDSSTK